MVTRILEFKNVAVQNVIQLSWMVVLGVTAVLIRKMVKATRILLFRKETPLMKYQIVRIETQMKSLRCLKNNLIMKME